MSGEGVQASAPKKHLKRYSDVDPPYRALAVRPEPNAGRPIAVGRSGAYSGRGARDIRAGVVARRRAGGRVAVRTAAFRADRREEGRAASRRARPQWTSAEKVAQGQAPPKSRRRARPGRGSGRRRWKSGHPQARPVQGGARSPAPVRPRAMTRGGPRPAVRPSGSPALRPGPPARAPRPRRRGPVRSTPRARGRAPPESIARPRPAAGRCGWRADRRWREGTS